MRACANLCEVRTPRNLGEALELTANTQDAWQPMAGATDLMVVLNAGKILHRRFMDIWQLDELRGIYFESDAVTMGALTTFADVLRHRELCFAFPLLAAAAKETGGVATQNRGTLGGNIMNASPAADTPPALLVYEAEVELTSMSGSRWLPYYDFHTGYRQTKLKPGELLTRIRVQRPGQHVYSRFRKIGPRKAQAISKVCFAAVWDREKDDIRIAYGSMAPVPLRCSKTEVSIRNGDNPAESLARELAPITDVRSNAAYRLRVAQNLLTDFLHDA